MAEKERYDRQSREQMEIRDVRFTQNYCGRVCVLSFLFSPIRNI